MLSTYLCNSRNYRVQKQPADQCDAAREKPAASAQTVTRLAADELKHLTGEWSVTAIGDSVLDVELLPVVNLQLPDNKNETNKNILLCYANGGCNTINGQFEVGDNGIIEPSGEFISTMMYCPEPNFDLMLGQAFADVKSIRSPKPPANRRCHCTAPTARNR